MPRTPRDVLRQVFGYEDFRGHQAAIVDHVLGGGDALVVMPTGAGKSLCYQIPALVRPGLGVVVSPLIALMHDQVRALLQLGVRAASLSSAMSFDEQRQTEAACRRGEVDLVYVAAERAVTPRFLELAAACSPSLIAIDEAHCVSQWGHDFRPEYQQLHILKARFPSVPRLALTATADQPTRNEILQHLQLTGAKQFLSDFDRPNIRYRVTVKDGPRQQLWRFLEEHRGEAGIVYCLSRKRVEETAEHLNRAGRKAVVYHAGLDAETRRRHQEQFLDADDLVVVATVAFGMGIDKPDVRFVAHFDLPKSIEAYYQETGRAGRDGLPAEAFMLYGLSDIVLLRQLLERSGADEARRRVERHKLNALLGYCETLRCRRQVLLGYFGQSLQTPCNNCDSCLEPPAAFDGTVAAQKAMSCVHRTGQRFGAGHLVDVLLGNATEKVQRFGHDQLPTFGVGKELSDQQWHSVYRQLVALGMLEVDVAGYGGMQLLPAAWPVLKSQKTLELRHDPEGKRGRSPKSKLPAVELGPLDATLLEALKQKRRELAVLQRVPAYVIFHDKTLIEMAEARPRDLGALGRVSGVGEAKLQRYGELFLAIIVEHTQATVPAS